MTISKKVKIDGSALLMGAAISAQCEHHGLMTLHLGSDNENKLTFNGEPTVNVWVKIAKDQEPGLETRARLVAEKGDGSLQVVSAISVRLTASQEDANESDADESYLCPKTAKNTATWPLWRESEAMQTRREKREAERKAKSVEERYKGKLENWRGEIFIENEAEKKPDVWKEKDDLKQKAKLIEFSGSNLKAGYYKLQGTARGRLRAMGMRIAQTWRPTDGASNCVHTLWEEIGVNPTMDMLLRTRNGLKAEEGGMDACLAIAAAHTLMDAHKGTVPKQIGAFAVVTAMEGPTQLPAFGMNTYTAALPWAGVIQLHGNLKLSMKKHEIGGKWVDFGMVLKEGEALIIPTNGFIQFATEAEGGCVTLTVGWVTKGERVYNQGKRSKAEAHEEKGPNRPSATSSSGSSSSSSSSLSSSLSPSSSPSSSPSPKRRETPNASSSTSSSIPSRSVLEEIEAGFDIYNL